MRTLNIAIVMAMAVTAASAARSTNAAEEEASILDQPSLLDGPGSPKQALRAIGINADFYLTNFNQGIVSGTGSKQWQEGGKGDLIVTFDGARLGLWSGLYVTVHQEWLYGNDANKVGAGYMTAVNTAMAFPRQGGYEADTSIVITQNFNEQWSLSVGKFNMLDAVAKTPLIGGGGLNTFMNLGLAAPISGVTPPYLVGGSLTLKTAPASFSLLVYDPRNAQNPEVIEHPFSQGTTASLSMTVPVKIAGLEGYQNVRGVYSSQTGVDFSALQQLGLPPAAQGPLGTKQGYWFLAYSFQQYLVQNAANPKEGWGFFGQFTVSDGNPNPVKWSMLAGLGGSSPIPGRSLDLWGIGYFRYTLGQDLVNGLAPLDIDLTANQGVEAYYNLAITPWFRMTANVQYVKPFSPTNQHAVFAGLRTQIKF